ncbi:MAG: 4-hydroxy-tetrahydrodipicolinate reductase [bacterium]|nr:4-hydroxy-tetrahydrodipicolinate reductase [bacterium]
MIRVAVSGAAGRMGRLAAAAITAEEDLELSAAYAPLDVGEVICGVAAVGDHDAVGGDVVVEFTNPDVVLANAARWGGRRLHMIIGTSGFDERMLTELADVWAGSEGNCLVVPNFSIGAVVMMRFAEMAAPHFGGVEVMEFHHDDKPDYPSGTALSTAARIAAAGGTNVPDAEGRGTDVDGVPVHSVRLPGVIASQEVMFGGLGETMSIRHDTFNREAFMPGMLTAIRGVAALPDKMTVGLDALLGI